MVKTEETRTLSVPAKIVVVVIVILPPKNKFNVIKLWYIVVDGTTYLLHPMKFIGTLSIQNLLVGFSFKVTEFIFN